FVAQSNTAGSYGQFSLGTDGAWSYVADSAHNEFAAGTTYTDTFAVSSADGTLTSVTVQILGSNDAAVLSSASANLTETDAPLTTNGTLTISDVDSAATFVAQSGTAGSYGQFSINAGGAWSYVANSAHNEFTAGTTYTDTFAVSSADGTLTSVTVQILGSNDAAVLSSASVTLTETNAPLTTNGSLTISDVDSAATFVAQSGTTGSYGQFSINAGGAWSYVADSAHNEFAAGTTYTDTFAVSSADGTLTSVTVQILGSNDAAVLSSASVTLTETNAPLTTNGTLTISDVDSTATFVAQSNTAGSYGQFSINAGGAWSYVADSAHNEFAAGTTYTDTFAVSSADGTATEVSITINGTNDAPITDLNGGGAGNDATAAFIEQTSVLIVPGATITDVDSANLTSMTATLTARPDGNATESLSLNAAATTAAVGLTVSYTASTGVLSITGSAIKATYQTILDGILYNNSSDMPTTSNRTVNVVVSDGIDSSISHSVTIGVTALNDTPVNTLPASYTTNEDTAFKLSGLSVADVDAGAGNISVTLTVGSGTLTAATAGSVTVSGSGTSSIVLTGTLSNINTYLGTVANQPTYTPVANANGAVTLTMLTNDGGNTGTGGALSDSDTININITALNDAPVNTLPASYTTNEDTAFKLSGLSVADVDAGAGTISVTLTVGSGTLTAATAGSVAVSGSGTSSIVLTGTLSNINTYLGTVANQPTY
ncbi:outer membrane adhesin like protein, partial [Pseudomonas sp. GM41(2012)]|uniref:beta strand repeat-containing protein n=1 Tax=Pseudomonas sp. (strain GM41(2012)) TaxID=1144708 RepID=UPI0003E804FD